MYLVEPDGSLLTQYAPAFIIENDQHAYNRIGTPTASIAPDGQEVISIDPDVATIYTRVDTFKTLRGNYTNLLYRIHFEQVPNGLIKGKNVGLLFIVTLDQDNRPLLYTSLHTCGCYLAFVPTTVMPEEFYPEQWQVSRQMIYGENLPARLHITGDSATLTPAFLIKDSSHRVKDILLKKLKTNYIQLNIQPFSALDHLPLSSGQTTSFFETTGPRHGYVKGSHKPYEKLLMGWWAFDWRVGEDKKLGQNKTDGICFYTSLKPWRREQSDLRDFTTFLNYWGWKL